MTTVLNRGDCAGRDAELARDIALFHHRQQPENRGDFSVGQFGLAPRTNGGIARVLHILTLGTSIDMRRVTTPAVMTAMIPLLTRGHGAIDQLPGEHMRRLSPVACEVKHAVTVLAPGSKPGPALVRATPVDILPKALNGGFWWPVTLTLGRTKFPTRRAILMGKDREGFATTFAAFLIATVRQTARAIGIFRHANLHTGQRCELGSPGCGPATCRGLIRPYPTHAAV